MRTQLIPGHSRLAPPGICSENRGRAAHSWRVLLLPYFERLDLYNTYRFNEPWDGPHNRLLLTEMPPEYRSPASASRDECVTDYVAVVGPGTAWSVGGDVWRGPALRYNEILMIEFPGSGIIWSEPRDLSVDEAMQVIRGGTYYLGTDLVCHQVPPNATQEDIKKLLTIGDSGVPAEKQSSLLGPEGAKRKATAPKTP